MRLYPEVMQEAGPGLGLGAGQDSLRGGRRHSERLEAEVGRGRGELRAHDAVYQGNLLRGVRDLGHEVRGHSLPLHSHLIEETGLHLVTLTLILPVLTLKTPPPISILRELQRDNRKDKLLCYICTYVCFPKRFEVYF